MVTSELLYSAFGAVVSAYKVSVSYVHDTNKIKDRESGLRFPACCWKLPTPSQQRAGDSDVFDDLFTFNLLFVDQTATDRDSNDMLHAHTRMEVIAKHCVRRFCDLYVEDVNRFEGVDIDLELIGSISYPPVWDDDTTMLTGVAVEFTVKACQPECVDSYFN